MTRLTRRFHLASALRPASFRIDPNAARGLIASGAVLVDIRRQDDPSAALEGAVRIAPDEMPGRAEEFRREVAIVLACT